MSIFNYDWKNSFKRDAKKHLEIFFSSEWIEVSHCLLNRLPIPEKYCDHALKGNLIGFRDCHIKPDIVLIYAVNEPDKLIELYRIGTHSELF